MGKCVGAHLRPYYTANNKFNTGERIIRNTESIYAKWVDALNAILPNGTLLRQLKKNLLLWPARSSRSTRLFAWNLLRKNTSFGSSCWSHSQGILFCFLFSETLYLFTNQFSVVCPERPWSVTTGRDKNKPKGTVQLLNNKTVHRSPSHLPLCFLPLRPPREEKRKQFLRVVIRKRSGFP